MADLSQIQLNGTTYNLKDAVTRAPYGVCNTAASTAAKTVTIDNFVLMTGITIHVKFTYRNTVSSPTLNVNETGAIAIKRYATTAAGTGIATAWYAGAVISLTYDGTNWVMNDWLNTDTRAYYVPYLYAGAANAIGNAATTNGNTKLVLRKLYYDESSGDSIYSYHNIGLIPDGNMEITSDASGNITFSSKINNYYDISEIGLTPGEATISDVWDALPNYSVIRFPRSEITDYPVNNIGYIEVVKTGPNEDLGSIQFYNRDYYAEDYRMYLTKDDTTGITSVQGVWRPQPRILLYEFSSISSLPVTFAWSSTNSAYDHLYPVTANHIVLQYELSNPSAQTSDWTITTANQSITISGTIHGTTNIRLVLGAPSNVSSSV